MADQTSDTLKSLGFVTQAKPLPASEAFVFASKWHGNKLQLQWQIKPGYYIYRSKLKFSLSSAPQAYLGKINYPPPEVINDPFFGKQSIYRHQLSLDIPIKGYWDKQARLVLSYQGCSGTLCYPPIARHFVMPKNTAQSPQTLGSILYSQHYLSALLLLLGLGILLCFTPCVLPMIPIISGIVLGRKQLSGGRAFVLSFIYVMGMALCYAVIGLIIASIGAGFQGFLQQPAVLVISALIFIALALSLFGVYRIELPHRLQTALAKINNTQKGGHMLSAFLMGVLATLVVSPCTSAPLVGVLGYIASSGNRWFGALALFTLAIGMGIPLIIIAIGGNRFLPKAGVWMYQIQRFLGILMLGVALWLISRIVPGSVTLALAGVILLIYAVILGLLKKSSSRGQWLRRVIALVFALYGAVLVIGGIQGNTNPLRPIGVPQVQGLELPFHLVQSPQQLSAQLAIAKQQSKPVLLDFYANWCLECHKLDAFTFANKAVKAQLNSYYLIRADVTINSVDSRALMKKMAIIGLPTIIFYNANGQVQPNLRMAGDIGPQELLHTLG